MRSQRELQFAIAASADLIVYLQDRESASDAMVHVAHWLARAPEGSFILGFLSALGRLIEPSRMVIWAQLADGVNVEDRPAKLVLSQFRDSARAAGLSREKFAALRENLRQCVAKAVVEDAGSARALKACKKFGFSPFDVPQPPIAPARSRPGVKKAAKKPRSAERATVPRMIAEDNHSRVSIYFGTNRARAPETAKYGTAFTSDRSTAADPLSLGLAHVSIPAAHKEGRIERPSFLKFEFRENRAKHMMIDYVTTYERPTWILAAKDRAKEGLLFVHGFNVDFEEALFRIAQIAYDLRFEGIPLCFSWASRGEVADYAVDTATVTWSAQHLDQFLKLVTSELNLDRVHLIAHSMGNRALLDVLRNWQHRAGMASIEQVVFAAPDVDAGVFQQGAAAFPKFARATMYASSKDRPLLLSKSLYAYPRAGDARPPLVVPHVDTVDASCVGAEMFGLGHSYFATKPKVFSDLFYLIWHGIPPAARASLRAVPGQGYFEIAG